MAWIAAARQKRGKTWVDSVDPAKHAIDATLAAVHYESAIDSGNFDAEIDCTPVKVNNAALDGWLITANGWHYALGLPKSGALSGLDGVVGFGGRGGQNWLKFRLTRVGYLHWSDLAWQDIGGAPTYTRTNLTSTVNSITLGSAAVKAESVATWNNIWTTPGGGALNVSWRAHGDGLKELITINQAARTWIQTNRPPTTPAAETWFGFVFRLDWSDVPKIYRDGVLKSIEDDYTGDVPIELRDATDKLLALLPIDDCWVEQLTFHEQTKYRLSKRFYKSGSEYYLLVGLRCDTIASLPSGPLVFDPTIDTAVSDLGNDGYQGANATTWVQTADIWVGLYSSGNENPGVRFTLDIAKDATITSGSVGLYDEGTTGNPVVVWRAWDHDDAPAFVTNVNYPSNVTSTTATVSWTMATTNAAWNWSPDFGTIIQEIVNRAGWTSGSHINIYGINTSTGGDNENNYSPLEVSAASAPKLHVEYTTGAGGNLSGSSVGTGTAWGTLTGTGAVSGRTDGTSTPRGTLTGAGALSGRTDGSAAAWATLTGAGALSGSSAGVSAAWAALVGAGTLSGRSDSVSVAWGILTGAGQGDLSGSTSGTSTAWAVLTGIGALTGRSDGLSGGDATLAGVGALAGRADGLATAWGTLQDATPAGALSGSTSGIAVAWAVLVGSGALSGATSGTAVAWAVLTNQLLGVGTSTVYEAGSRATAKAGTRQTYEAEKRKNYGN